MRSGPQIYVKGSLEAAALYVKAFNLRVDPEITFFNPDGTYSHASLMSGEDGILAVAEDKDDRHNDKVVGDKAPVMSFNVWDLGTKEAVDHAYAVLSEEARINYNPNGPECPFWDTEGNQYWFGLVDKFGVHWGVGK